MNVIQRSHQETNRGLSGTVLKLGIVEQGISEKLKNHVRNPRKFQITDLFFHG